MHNTHKSSGHRSAARFEEIDLRTRRTSFVWRIVKRLHQHIDIDRRMRGIIGTYLAYFVCSQCGRKRPMGPGESTVMV